MYWKDHNRLHEDAFEAAESIGWFNGGLSLLQKKRGCRIGSLAAYVQRVIKVKDLQFSPGPQQPRTLLGITENDLQGGRTVRLPKLPRLLRNQNHIIPI